ncbi:hypothetical protein ACEQPO_02620 [Bacillus sp. SL00103]
MLVLSHQRRPCHHDEKRPQADELAMDSSNDDKGVRTYESFI